MQNQSVLIKSLRKQCGLNQTQFAQKVGTQPTRVSEYETNKHQISLSKFLEWCNKVNVEFKNL